jgi:hypothetical protein
MPIQSSFPKVAEQVLSLNKNVIDILSKLSEVTTSTKESVQVSLLDENGVPRTYSLPTISSLKSEISRLDNNIKAMNNIDTTGSLIQTSPGNFKKVVAVDLNRDPSAISTLGSVTQFKASNNWFFDSMLNPMLSVEIDLQSQIEDNVRRILVRRYIVEFERDGVGNLTATGQSALNSFNAAYRSSSINITDFETWHKSTPGVADGQNPKIDEQIFELEPNELKYMGEFSVSQPVEDRINRKLWYPLNTLDYIDNSTGGIAKLEVGSELIVNMAKTNTRYKVIEISTAAALPRIRVERIEGMDPIVQGVGTLKVYSPVISNKKVKISIGYNERNIVFAKAINDDNHIMSKDWSTGTGFYTNDLTLNSPTGNGTIMEDYYTNFVYDYGILLKDMVAKKIPNSQAGTPVSPTLVSTNFNVVQVNTHLTDTPDSKLLRQKSNYQKTLKSEIEQLNQAIIDRNKKAKVEKFKSESAKKQAQLEIDDLTRKRDSKSKLMSTVTQEILDLSKNPLSKSDPKFAIRGFWSIPDPTIVNGTKSQEIVQFLVQYKYLSNNGREPQITTFNIDNTQNTGAFSNWNEMKTPARRRLYDPSTSAYTWEKQDLSNADIPNINQIDIPIQPNEKVQFRIKSISEAGWPESPVESDWSDIMEMDFPAELVNNINQNQSIASEANKEELKTSVMTDLATIGVTDHVSDQATLGNKTFHHKSSKILSEFTDSSGNALDLYEYLKSLQDRIKMLEEKIQQTKGTLKVSIIEDGSKEVVVSNGSETKFNLECEDFCTPYEDTNIGKNRVYQNNIYVIDKFVIKVSNVSSDSSLGLLSGSQYTSNIDIFKSDSPQVFWLDTNDNLIVSEDGGVTKTQMDNQFVWSVNYDKGNSLGMNIGNQFTQNGNNSIVKSLGSEQYNIAYGDTTKMSFIGNNLKITENSKWIDTDGQSESRQKLLTTVLPVTTSLNNIRELNQSKSRSLNAGDDIAIPVKIFFKLNALDNSANGEGFKYVDLSESKTSVKHIKSVKFMLQNQSDQTPFKFTVTFIINRNRTAAYKQKSFTQPYIIKNDLNP